MTKKLPTKLPQYLHRFFWDIDASRLDPSQHPQYVAIRLLDKGNIKAWRWLFGHFSQSQLEKYVANSRQMSKFSRPLWAAYFQTARVKELCKQKEFLQSRGTAWPY